MKGNKLAIALGTLVILGSWGYMGLGLLIQSDQESSSPSAETDTSEVSESSAASDTEDGSGNTVDSDLFQDALETGYGAAVAAQTASTPEDWESVAKQWDEAVDLLGQVPSTSENYEAAQKKISEYQANRNAANNRLEDALASDPEIVLALFDALLRDVDPDGSLIESVDLMAGNDATVDVSVSNLWDVASAEDKQAIVQAWWEGWKNIRSPDNPDLARLRILRDGRQVAGSREKGSDLFVYE